MLATSSRRCSTPAKRPQGRAHGVGLEAARQADRRGRHRVAAVVQPAQADLLDPEQRLVGPPQLPGAVGELGLRAVAEAHAPRAAAEVLDPEPERGDRDVVVALVGEDAQLGLRVGLEGAVAVDVVGREVEQHGALGSELDGVLELEGGDLADHGRVGCQVADERAQGGADVAGDRHRPPGLAVDVADELGRRRLAVGPGHGDELVGDQPPRELDLAQHRQAALARGGDDGGLRRARPGDLTTTCTCSSAAGVSSPCRRSTPRACSPRCRSTSSAATPERARPTTSHGPGGSGGRRGMAEVLMARASMPMTQAPSAPAGVSGDAKPNHRGKGAPVARSARGSAKRVGPARRAVVCITCMHLAARAGPPRTPFPR